MKEKTVMGVDFSGAETRNATQVTEAVLRGEVLELKPYRTLPRSMPKTHEELKRRIWRLPNNAVVAMDFPFSVPRAFAREVAAKEGKGPVRDMSGLWSVVAEMEYPRFKMLRHSFVKRQGEMLRRGDVNFGGPFSPLHTINPGMLKMTFEGMRMLHGLWEKGCRVPPLPDEGRSGPVLLETMPGVLLRGLGLSAENYKTRNSKNGGCPKKFRTQILDGMDDRLTATYGLVVCNLSIIKEKCTTNHDVLDSLVAAIGAAVWAMDDSRFLVPRKSIGATEEIDAARVEGWIYAPRKSLRSGE